MGLGTIVREKRCIWLEGDYRNAWFIVGKREVAEIRAEPKEMREISVWKRLRIQASQNIPWAEVRVKWVQQLFQGGYQDGPRGQSSEEGGGGGTTNEQVQSIYSRTNLAQQPK